jgi:hypothetical protein
MVTTFRRKFIALLSLGALAFLTSSSAKAVVVPINFTGAAQDFSATATLTGNVNAVGSGATKNIFNQISKFNFTPPLDHPLKLDPTPVIFSSDPKTDPLGTTFDLSATTLFDMFDTDLDLLNGKTAPIAIDTITITSNSSSSLLKSLTVDISGTLSQLNFVQTGAPTILGGGGSGTFTLPGDISLTLTGAKASLAGLINIDIPDISGAFSQDLTGTWTLSGPGNNLKISLDGAYSISAPLSVQTALAISTGIPILLPGLTVSSTLDLVASLNLALTYHLEQTGLVVPEPGSVVLLGVGLLCFAPFLRRYWHRK